MEERLREEKQKYLRQNILEKQYDAEEFMDFCQSQKGSVDIDSWTIGQLQQLVRMFIQAQKQQSPRNSHVQHAPFNYQKTQSSKIQNIDWDNVFQQKQPKQQAPVNFDLNLIDLDFLEMMGESKNNSNANKQPPPVPQPPKIQKQPGKIASGPDQILSKLNDKNNQFISAYNSYALENRDKKEEEKKGSNKQVESGQYSPTIVKKESKPIRAVEQHVDRGQVVEESFKASVKCRTFANKPKLDQDYEVVVTGHQIVNPNMFVPNYVLYSITTNPLAVEVKRRLKDFEMLRNLLKKVFPTTQIPHLQRYGRRLSETEPNVIRKQKLFLQSFLNSLLMNKNIRCKIMDDFLLCQNLDSLKKIFRQMEKVERPKAIEDLYTPTGRAEVNYNPQYKKYINQQELYFQYLEANLIKLKELYDHLSTSLANSVRILSEISDLYDNLRDSTKNVNNLMQEPLKSVPLENSFDKISDLHKHWALSMKTQAKIIEVEARHICRYETTNIDTIKEVTKVCGSIVDNYSKRGDKAQAAREQYEFNKRLNDYKNGLDSASKSTTVLRYQAGHLLHSTVNEIGRYLSELGEKLNKRFRTFSTLQLNICHDLENNWREFQTYANLNRRT